MDNDIYMMFVEAFTYMTVLLCIWLFLLFIYIRKKNDGLPHTFLANILKTYASAAIAIVLFVFNFGYFRMMTLGITIPVLIFFIIANVLYGKDAANYPSGLKALNCVIHVFYVIDGLIVPDNDDSNHFLFFGFVTVPDSVATMLQTIGCMIFIGCVAMLIVQCVWAHRIKKA